jgi:hypothetical protein
MNLKIRCKDFQNPQKQDVFAGASMGSAVFSAKHRFAPPNGRAGMHAWI